MPQQAASCASEGRQAPAGVAPIMGIDRLGVDVKICSDQASTEDYMGDIDAATIRALGNKLESIEILERAPGSGFRIKLYMRSRYGTPIVETHSRRFETISEADQFIEREFGAVDIGVKLE